MWLDLDTRIQVMAEITLQRLWATLQKNDEVNLVYAGNVSSKRWPIFKTMNLQSLSDRSGLGGRKQAVEPQTHPWSAHDFMLTLKLLADHVSMSLFLC